MGIMEREAAAEWAELVSLREEVSRLREAVGDACDAERVAIMHTGRADATKRLMALALREGRLDVAEGLAEMVLDGHDPKVIAEMREAKEGVRPALVGWPVEVLMRSMVEEIEAVGAKNYLEWPITIRGLGIALRIERIEGKSPATLAAEACEEALALRAERDAAWGAGAEAMRAAILRDPDMVLSEHDEARILALPVPAAA